MGAILLATETGVVVATEAVVMLRVGGVTTYDTNDCIARIRRYLPQPGNLDFPTNDDLYAMMYEAENEVKRDILQCCPWLMLQAPVLMTTSDSGLTWTFGTDANTNAITPYGAYAIYRRKEDVPDFPMERGVEYIDENVRIRMPANRPDAISYPDGAPYYYGAVPTVAIDGSTAPSLVPADARILTVWKTVANVLIALGSDESDAEKRYQELLNKTIASEQLASQNSGALLASRSATPPRYRRLLSPMSWGRGW